MPISNPNTIANIIFFFIYTKNYFYGWSASLKFERKKTQTEKSLFGFKSELGGSRTPNLQSRNLVHYPVMLRVQDFCKYIRGIGILH